MTIKVPGKGTIHERIALSDSLNEIALEYAVVLVRDKIRLGNGDYQFDRAKSSKGALIPGTPTLSPRPLNQHRSPAHVPIHACTVHTHVHLGSERGVSL